MRRFLTATAIIAAVLAAAACSSRAATPHDAEPRLSPASTVPKTESAAAAPSPVPAQAPAPVEGAVIRFRTAEASVDVTISTDNAATRDLLSMLPLTLEFTDFAGREKVADLPRGLDRAGVPGSDPEDGDLISYIPWGNLAFYYDASGIGFDENVVRLGTTSATLDQLGALEAGPVTIDRIDAG